MKGRKYPTRIEGKITKEYRAWKGMKARCYAPCNKNMGKYQTTGIVVCQRWLNSFDNFMDDMGVAPSTFHTLDRINSEGNYSPDNCRWALRDVQAKNRSGFNHYFTIGGRTLVLKDWAKEYDISYTTLRHRIIVQNLTIEEAIKKA